MTSSRETEASREARDVAVAQSAILALLARRAPDQTICPSEVARFLVSTVAGEKSPGEWHRAMPLVHAAVDRLMESGAVRLSWKGSPLKVREGPYRIGRAAPK